MNIVSGPSAIAAPAKAMWGAVIVGNYCLKPGGVKLSWEMPLKPLRAGCSILALALKKVVLKGCGPENRLINTPKVLNNRVSVVQSREFVPFTKL